LHAWLSVPVFDDNLLVQPLLHSVKASINTIIVIGNVKSNKHPRDNPETTREDGKQEVSQMITPFVLKAVG
jgi:hypothetical protein